MYPVYKTKTENEGPFRGLSKGSFVGFVYGSMPAFSVGNPRVEFGGISGLPPGGRWVVGFRDLIQPSSCCHMVPPLLGRGQGHTQWAGWRAGNAIQVWGVMGMHIYEPLSGESC